MEIYPPLFGPMFWDTIMLIAYMYPNNPTDEDKSNITQWFELTMKLLPCPAIMFSSLNYVDRYKLDVSNKQLLLKWVVEFHNYVNIKLGKETYTVDEAIKGFIQRKNQICSQESEFNNKSKSPDMETINSNIETINKSQDINNESVQIINNYNSEGLEINESSHSETNTETINLNIETINPNIETINPNIETINPNTETMTPNTETINPNTETINPNVETINPNTETITPNIETITPNTETINPNTVNKSLDVNHDMIVQIINNYNSEQQF